MAKPRPRHGRLASRLRSFPALLLLLLAGLSHASVSALDTGKGLRALKAPDASSASSAGDGGEEGGEYRPTHMQLLQHMANAAALTGEMKVLGSKIKSVGNTVLGKNADGSGGFSKLTAKVMKAITAGLEEVKQPALMDYVKMVVNATEKHLGEKMLAASSNAGGGGGGGGGGGNGGAYVEARQPRFAGRVNFVEALQPEPNRRGDRGPYVFGSPVEGASVSAVSEGAGLLAIKKKAKQMTLGQATKFCADQGEPCVGFCHSVHYDTYFYTESGTWTLPVRPLQPMIDPKTFQRTKTELGEDAGFKCMKRASAPDVGGGGGASRGEFTFGDADESTTLEKAPDLATAEAARAKCAAAPACVGFCQNAGDVTRLYKKPAAAAAATSYRGWGGRNLAAGKAPDRRQPFLNPELAGCYGGASALSKLFGTTRMEVRPFAHAEMQKMLLVGRFGSAL